MIERYTTVISKERDFYVARFVELGFAVRGVGVTRASAVEDLESAAEEGFGDLEERDMPSPLFDDSKKEV